MTTVKNNAGNILKEYLKDHGIKQTFVANKMGLTVTNFNQRLNGRLKFTADFAISAATALGISPDIFLKKNYSYRINKEKEKCKN